MKLFVWNINQRSSGKGIPGFVNKEIIDSNADIVVLTEFISAAHKESIRSFIENLNKKYDCCYNEDRDKERRANGILIAVKKGFADLNSPASERLVSDSSEQDQPNFLQVKIVVDKKPITIIGTRIQIDCKKSRSESQKVRREEYKERRVQLLSLIEHISTLKNKNIIIAGDFNHAAIHGVEKESYADVRESYHYTSKGEPSDLYDTYNYHIMQDDFTSIGMATCTPEGKQYSCGFHLIGNTLGNGCFKEDHIITKDLIVSNLKYDHLFMENYKKNEERKYVIAPPYPDHAILTADVDI